MPLLDAATLETRRFVAAALSECKYPPADLVRRLTKEPVEIAAPLLVRSEALSEADLVSLIARQGLPHAQAIAKRPKLSRKIAALIETLAKEREATCLRQSPDQPAGHQVVDKATSETPHHATNPAPVVPGAAAEEVRRKLREMVREHEERSKQRWQAPNPETAAQNYQKLKATALAGTAAFFQTALADVLAISFARARSLTGAQNYTMLMVALRALDLDEAQAFLLVSATFPTTFGDPEAIRLFVERYGLLHRDAAIERMRYWVTGPDSDATGSRVTRFGSDADKTTAPEKRVMRS